MRQLMNVITTGALALAFTAGTSSAIPQCVDDLFDAQQAYGQLVQAYEAGKADLRDLVELQQKFAAAVGCYEVAQAEIVAQRAGASLADTEAYVFAVQASVMKGTATVADLVAAKEKLAAVTAVYEAAAEESSGCTMQLHELQQEYAALVESFVDGKATLGDLIALQIKIAEVMSCFDTGGDKDGAIAGSPTAQLEQVSWSALKSSFR